MSPLRKRRPDFAAEGLLKGLRGKRRAARLELLKHLHRQGVTLEELRAAIDEDRLAVLPVERLLADDKKYTARQVADKAGVDLDLLLEQRRATGLPVPDADERALSDHDVEAARRMRQALEIGLPVETLVQGARIFGRVTSQAAAAARLLAVEAFIQAGDTEHDLGLRIAEAARTLQPQTGETIRYLYEAHMRELLRNDVIAASELASGRIAGTREVAVCFADLVDFTRLGEQVPSEDLGVVTDRLGALAHDVARHPVSMIKTIGDAVMLVSPEPAPLLDAALSLLDAVESEDGLPQVKAGIAYGEALNRWGDWYGSPVNLASRVTTVARPSSVLTTADVRDMVADSFRWSFVGRRQLKGIAGDVALYRCRRRQPEGSE
jgi:adenylate cyclase